MFPQVGIGEEGDVVARVPIERVNNVVKVLGRLVEEVVEGFDELQAILGVNSIDQLKFQLSFANTAGHPVELAKLN